MAWQQRLRAGFPQRGGAVRLKAARPLAAGATALLLPPPPPGGASLCSGGSGPPQGAAGGSVSEEGAQSSQHAGLRPQTAEQKRTKCHQHLVDRLQTGLRNSNAVVLAPGGLPAAEREHRLGPSLRLRAAVNQLPHTRVL